MKLNTKIISGFPGVGKTYFKNRVCDLTVLDSDSSNFSWIEKGIRNPDFPQNYIQHIKQNMGKVDIILVSSHDIVRKALKDNKLNYIIVYPDINCKEEYISRFKKRNNDEKFIKFISDNWDKFIKEIENDNFPTKIKLKEGQYLVDTLQ